MISGSLLVGIDIGTGGCKTTIVSEDGTVVSTAYKEYPTSSPRPGWAEQNPDDWWIASVATLEMVMKKGKVSPKNVASICVDGIPHVPVLLDEKGSVIRPSIIYTDRRSVKETGQIKKSFGERILEMTFNQVSPAWTISILLWIKEKESQSWRKISKIILPKDYIRFKLTGTLLTDITDAMTTMLMDARSLEWSKELCSIIGLQIDVLPKVVPSTKAVGEVAKKEDTNIIRSLEGIPVVAGADDVCAENFGAGLTEEGQWSVKLATTGRITWLTEKAHPHPDVITYPYVIPHMWLSGIPAPASPAESLRWFRDIFCREEKKVADLFDISAYKLMDLEAENSPTGSEGLIFHPYLGSFGAGLKGNIFGIQRYHQKSHFIRSLLEGVSFSLKERFIFMKNNLLNDTKIRIKENALLLGGGSRSKLWSQILSDILGIEMWAPQVGDASFGSALLGGIGVHVFKNPQDAMKKCTKISKKIHPNPKKYAIYQKTFNLYQEIHKKLEDLSMRLNNTI